MRYGFWLPVFGGWLRNVEDEHMEPTWDYARRLTQRAEELGYSLTLIAELNLNDIKGVDAPSLDAWSTAAALAAVTNKTGADGGCASDLPQSCTARQAGRQHRPHLEGSAHAECRVKLVGGRSHQVRNPLRQARRPLRANLRVA